MHFMSAEELNISAAERDGLIALIGDFRAHRIKHNPDRDGALAMVNDVLDKDAVLVKQDLGFNMTVGTGIDAHADDTSADCGAAACIGGHLYLRMKGLDTSNRYAYPARLLVEAQDYTYSICSWPKSTWHPLNPLFSPSAIPEGRWDEITPEQAAVAVEHFLRTGNANEAWLLAAPHLHN